MKKISFLILAILLIVASCTKKAAPTKAKETATTSKETPKKETPKDAVVVDAASANLFTGFCSKCHGATGTEGRAPNLAMTSLSKTEISGVITNGQGRMPAFASKLTAAQISSLGTYVASLKK